MPFHDDAARLLAVVFGRAVDASAAYREIELGQIQIVQPQRPPIEDGYDVGEIERSRVDFVLSQAPMDRQVGIGQRRISALSRSVGFARAGCDRSRKKPSLSATSAGSHFSS